MARVTVEDCIEKVSDRFELVMLAAQRARKIGSGAAITVERENDKKTVIALREIAEETINIDDLKEELITSYQRYLPQDSDDDEIDLMDGEKEWNEKEGEAENSSSSIYANEEIIDSDEISSNDDNNKTPSLSDIAGI